MASSKISADAKGKMSEVNEAEMKVSDEKVKTVQKEIAQFDELKESLTRSTKENLQKLRSFGAQLARPLPDLLAGQPIQAPQ